MKLANLVDGLVVSEEVRRVAGGSSEEAEVEVVEDMVETEAMAVTEASVAIGAMVVEIEAMGEERGAMVEATDPTVAADTPTGVVGTLVAAAVDTGITEARVDMTVLVDPTETVTTATTESLDVLYLITREAR